MTSNDIYSILSSKPHNQHYLLRYIKFIEYCTRVNSTLSANIYTEEHHICPKADDLFPEYTNLKDNKWNSVTLISRQHFIAHWILSKAYGKSQIFALIAMNNQLSPEHIKLGRYSTLKSSRSHEIARTNASKLISLNNKGKVACYNTITNQYESVTSEEFYKNNHLIGANSFIDRSYMQTDEYKDTCRKSASGRVMILISDQRKYVKKEELHLYPGYVIDNHFGSYDRTQYQKTCSHCGKSFSPSNFKRWHGDNCKLNPLLSA